MNRRAREEAEREGEWWDQHENLAETIETVAAETPVAVAKPEPDMACPNCPAKFPANDPFWFRQHLKTCLPKGQAEADGEEPLVPWDEHDEARVRRTGTYEERIERENQSRFGNPLGPKGAK